MYNNKQNISFTKSVILSDKINNSMIEINLGNVSVEEALLYFGLSKPVFNYIT